MKAAVALLLATIMAGCETAYLRPLDERTLNDQAVRQQASQGPAEAIITSPEGDVGSIQRAPIPTDDLCFVRSRYIRGALVPRRCSELGRLN
jgi:hypothetical protein